MGLRGSDKCLAKVADDEPIFVLRAKDLTAPSTVRGWAHHARAVGCAEPKVQEAFNLAASMESWAQRNGGKYPD